MQYKNWIEIGGTKFGKDELIALENTFPVKSIEYNTLSFSQLWLNDTKDFIQKSSGSTGTPKIHTVSRQQMQASASATTKTLGLKAGDTALLSISPEFIGGKMMIVRSLEHNLNLIVGEVSGKPLSHLDEQAKIDFFSFVPYQLAKILEEQDKKALHLLNKAKAIILGGAAVSESLSAAILQHITTPVYSTYGMTETVSHVALKLINGSAPESFKALDGISFSQDNRNCLVIHAPTITGKQMLITNDVVNLIDKKHFEWLGRYDFVINSGGIKLHPEQIELKIEKLLKEHSITNRFFLFGLPHPQLGEQLCLIAEGEFDQSRWTKMLKTSLSPYEVPKLLFEGESFIQTKSEKLDRSATLASSGILL